MVKASSSGPRIGSDSRFAELARRGAAEFVGTFALVFAGCGAIVVDAETDGALGQVGISIAFGLVVMAMIYALGHVSGAHINPAVTFAFALTRHLSWSLLLMLVVMAVTTDTRAVGEAAAIAIGGTVALDVMFGGPISGASLNPARSLGPGLVSGDLSSIWIYLAAPLVGASLAALTYRALRTDAGRPAELREAGD